MFVPIACQDALQQQLLRFRDNHGASSARPAAAVAPERRTPVPGTTRREAASSRESADDLLYARGPISGLPEEFSSRRERFAELDALQEGWQVELSRRRGSSAVDAVFYAPNGEYCIGLILVFCMDQGDS